MEAASAIYRLRTHADRQHIVEIMGRGICRLVLISSDIRLGQLSRQQYRPPWKGEFCCRPVDGGTQNSASPTCQIHTKLITFDQFCPWDVTYDFRQPSRSQSWRKL
jgi:hypothetical protein